MKRDPARAAARSPRMHQHVHTDPQGGNTGLPNLQVP
jgi:hypothetical protein